MSLELHAALGFLQAIHHSARVAKVNSQCCRAVSRAIGRIRPILEELDMATADGNAQPKLVSLSAALENVHMMIVRFSAMGELQAVLESEAMVWKFTQACQEVAATLQSLLKENIKCLVGMEDDINRTCEQLHGLNISSSLANKQLARDVRSTAMSILEGKCPRSEGHMRIRNMLYVICRYARDNIVQEVQGLERERSRAQAEHDEQELGILTEVIRALEKRAPAAAMQCPPQPPVEYLCPISHSIMSDPVILVETGQTYDRPCIEEWFRRGNSWCPITKHAVHQCQLTPNYALKSLASTWIDVHGHGQEGMDCIGRMGKCNMDNPQQKGGYGMQGSGDSTADSCKGGAMGTVDIGAVPAMDIQATLNSLVPDMIFDKLGVGRKANENVLSDKGEWESSNKYSQFGEHKSGGAVDKSTSLLKKQDTPVSFTPANTALEALKSALNQRPKSLDAPWPMAKGQGEGAITIHASAGEGAPAGKGVPVAPRSRRLSIDSIPRSEYGRVPGQGRTSFEKLSKTHGSQLSRIPLARQGSMKYLHEAISSSRRSLDKYHVPQSNEGSPHKRNGDMFRIKQPSPSVPRRSPWNNLSTRDRTEQHAAADLDDAASSSAFSHPCSISCGSESCDEVELNHFSQGYQVQNEAVWYDVPGFDAESMASFSTIGPGRSKVISAAPRPPLPHTHAVPMQHPAPAGAVNLLFDDNMSDCTDFEAVEVSTPVLVEMIKSSDMHVAASSANELALRVIKDPTAFEGLQCSGVIERLVEMLQAEASDVKLAAARTLGTLGEKCDAARAQIVKIGASRPLVELARGGSVRCMDVADWALNRLSRDSAGSGQLSAPSVEVSTPMLVQMMLSGEVDVQASAVLDLKDRLLSSLNGFDELAKPDVMWRLVDLLEHEHVDVQQAAATVLSLVVFRNQDMHSQVATRAGTVLRLVRLVKEADHCCAAAAAQVLRTLAHGNSDVCDEILARDIIPALEGLLMCPTALAGAREVAAWLLGILGAHTEDSQELIQGSRAVFSLQHLLEVGEPHEVVAASWALQSILSTPGESNGNSVSVPIVLEALRSGTDNLKAASVCELCHLANEGFWLQMDIVKNGGLRSLLKYLENEKHSDGSHAALVTIHKIIRDVPSTPVELCREGGVHILVDFLQAPDRVERRLAMEILSVLADKCPLYQPEVVTEGTVPLLTELLLEKDQSVCNAAFGILMKLADSEMSVVTASMAAAGVPMLLKIVGGDAPISSKEAAAQLLEAVACSVEGQQVLVDEGGMNLLMKIMENGESYGVRKIAGNVVALLAKRDSNAHMNLVGSGALGTLVEILQSASTQRKALDLQDSDEGHVAPHVGSGGREALQKLRELRLPSVLARTPAPAPAPTKSNGRHTTLPTMPKYMSLPAVHESIAEDCESYQSPEAADVQCHPCSIDDSESVTESCSRSNEIAEDTMSCASDSGEKVKSLVDILRRGDGSGREKAAVQLRSLVQGDKVSRLELVKSGAVPLLVELLQSKSFK